MSIRVGCQAISVLRRCRIGSSLIQLQRVSHPSTTRLGFLYDEVGFSTMRSDSSTARLGLLVREAARDLCRQHPHLCLNVNRMISLQAKGPLQQAGSGLPDEEKGP